MTTTYTKMLESEIDKSYEFTRDNFGLKVGDEFPEIVRELCQSEKITAKLFMNVMLTGLMGSAIAKSLAEVPEGQKPNFGDIVLKHLSLFEIPLALFYWGIQIGRNLEKQSADTLKEMDRK